MRKSSFSAGFEATTMAEILLVSRLSKGGFHHHFSSKDEPLFSEFEQLPDRIADSLGAVAVNVS
ncbi:TetR/AcrR family transcriptional regulator [Lentilitoribacter sp. EG35]|uniref:TetR/AcrR family transcriptional regulator n=1 Tax=Lentilitoribacter sp. EG35 TaxID=3234192 RepID=UPI0034607E3D